MSNKKPTRVLTSLNLKGGVGKTHLCWLILGVAHERKERCLVIDLDKQANITTSLVGEVSHRAGSDQFFNPTIEPEVSQLILPTSLAGVDLIPASFAIERFNKTNPDEWEQSDVHLSLVDPLREIAQFYDYVLFDCPADISLVTYAALCASDFLLVPLEAAEWGALGPQHILKTYEHVRENANDRLQLLGFVVSRFKRARIHQKEYLQQLRRHFGDDAFETVIPDSAKFEQSVNERVPITVHSPSSHASSIARQLFDEIDQRCHRFERSRPKSGRKSL